MEQRFTRRHFANYFTILLFLGLYLPPSVLEAQIQGKVYRDFNANGVFDSTTTFKEIGLLGITVTAYNAAGTTVGTTTTNSTGNYTIPSVSGALRVEFSGIDAADFAAPKGTGNNTSVQFVTAPITAINFGVNYPNHYCQSTPLMATNCYINGNNSSGTSGSADVLVKFSSSNTSNTPTPTHLGRASEMGTTWGLAYQRTTGKIFSAAYLKRHTGFGPLGTGGIYVTDAAAGTTSSFVNLNGLGGISTGTDPHSGLVSDKTQPSKDSTAFHKIGKLSLGDMDISDDDKYLFVVNLNTRQIHKIYINSPAVVPTASEITSYTIPNPCGNDDYRPFAVKYYRGKVYVGIVCTAEGSQNRTTLAAHVYSMDAATGVFSATPILSTSLDFTRGKPWRPETTTNKWFPWTNTWTSAVYTSNGATLTYPQPILSDIEFDVDGSMILGFRDRLGDQLGIYNQYPNGTAYSAEVVTGGDIMRAAASGSTWVMESNGMVGSLSSGAANGEGIGGSEFYKGDLFYGNETTWGHQEIGNGGLALIAGSGEVAMTALDPAAESFGFNGYNSGGVRFLNNTTGAFSDGYIVYDTDSAPGTFQKSNGLGDLEALCDAATIEIGNRVWSDTDQDGVQDAGEAGIDGITVKLFEGTTEVGSTITANGGQYYFTNANVTGGVKYNTAYEIRIATSQTPLSTLSLTTTDVASNGSDLIDNDGAISGANAIKAFTTGNAGENNHSYDFGYSSFSSCDTTLVVTNATICNGATVNLFTLASGVKGTLTYSTNGTTWTALTSPTNVIPSVTTTYYVKDTLIGGCFDIDTLVITVNPQPTTPSVSSPVMNICPLTTVDLTTISSALTPSVSGGVFEWHVSNSSASAMVNNPNNVVAGDYYLFERSPTGCYSTGLKVTTTIQSCCPTPLCIPVTITKSN